MTRTRFAAMTIIALGFASTASAQGRIEALRYEPPMATVRIDPLDPVSRAAMLAAKANVAPAVTPMTPANSFVYLPAPQRLAPQPVQVIADEKPAGPSKFLSALQNISQTLQVSHEALDVYEHAIEANALKNLYSGR